MTLRACSRSLASAWYPSASLRCPPVVTWNSVWRCIAFRCQHQSQPSTAAEAATAANQSAEFNAQPHSQGRPVRRCDRDNPSPRAGAQAQLFQELLQAKIGRTVELAFIEKRRASGAVFTGRVVGEIDGRRARSSTICVPRVAPASEPQIVAERLELRGFTLQ